MVNGDMASVSGNMHTEQVAAPDTSMLLRERIKRLMGNGIYASWKSLSEVKSSGLLESLSEKQIALEELKFCLITCEVAYNTELNELLSLSKKSISWADPLPTFNRRTIASTIERVKRCSDGFLNAFEKQWNMKPVVNLVILNKIFTDMALQFSNYITYCTHQEDFQAVLRTARRSKYEVAAASFSSRLNVERVMLPLQHLKLYRLLFQDIRSMLMSTTNCLDNFHCKRILMDITKLLEECYKVLATLHGSQYVEKMERLLDESVHGFEPEPAGNNTSKYQNILTDQNTICGIQSTDSVYDSDSKSSEVCTPQVVNKNVSPSVKEQCKFSTLQTVQRNCRNVVNCSDNLKATLKRQQPIHTGRRKAVDITLKCRSCTIIKEKCAVFEVGEPKNNLCQRNKSEYSVFKFTNVTQNTIMKDRKRSSCLNETVYGSLENEGSKKDVAWMKDKLKISVDNNVSKPPHVTSLNSTNPHQVSIPNISRDFTNSGTESSCAKDAIREYSIHDKWKVENDEVSNNLQPSTVKQQSVLSLAVQDNGCQKLYEHCDADEQLDTGPLSNTSTSPVTPPQKVLCTIIDAPCSQDDLHTNGFQTGSVSCTYEVKREVQYTPQNEEEKCSDNFSFLSYVHYECGSPSCDMPSSTTKEISCTEEAVLNKSHSNEQSRKHKKQIFISFYDLGCLNTPCEPHLPLQKESIKVNEIYSYYEPMNELFRRNCHWFKKISPFESFDRTVSGGSRPECGKGQKTDTVYNVRVDDCENAYEECRPYDTNDTDISKSSLLSTYEDVPLYQAYNFESVTSSNTKAEEDTYREPDKHVYEEITFHFESKPQGNEEKALVSSMEISKPSGSSQRALWSDITEVISSGLLDRLDSSEITLQEAKYEVITSEASYYKSLLILEAVFITSKELSDSSVLSKEDHTTLFSSTKKVKQCSEKFLGELLDGWQEDLLLGYLCHAVSKFISSGNFQVYVDYCASQIHTEKTLQRLKVTNPKFTSALSRLEADPICQTFTLQTFLTLPMQRVTRLPLLVQAILKYLPSDHSEHSAWSEVLVQLQKIAEECNDAAGRSEMLETQPCNHHVHPNNKTQNMNMKQPPPEKKQTTIWNRLKIRKQKTM